MLWEAEDGSLEIRYRGTKLGWTEMGSPPLHQQTAEKSRPRLHQPAPPKADHPWKKYAYPNMKPLGPEEPGNMRLLQVPSVTSP